MTRYDLGLLVKRYFEGFRLPIPFSTANWPQHMGVHLDAFVDERRHVFDRLFSERVRTVLPNVIESAIRSRGPSVEVELRDKEQRIAHHTRRGLSAGFYFQPR